MFVELIEHLRCPAPHEPTVLIVAATRSGHRHILDGILGCPQCGAEYPISDGIARFGAAPRVIGMEADIETATRIAAFLELTDARGFALLTGMWCSNAEAVARIAETPLVLVNPPEGASITGAAAVIETDGTLPIAAASARAMAFDAVAVGDDWVRTVRAGGRVLGAAAVPLPAGLVEIARDAREWVAERDAGDVAPRFVELKRADGTRRPS